MFDAVRELMTQQGMQVSMEAVAARAGCSKQTLYSRYGSKQALLGRVLDRHVARATTALRAPQGDDLRGSLCRFAEDYLDHFNQPQVVQACRMMSADAARFPEQARYLYDNGTGTLTLHLAEHLSRAAADGKLAHDDPHFMAELLISMIAGQDVDRQRFHAAHRQDAHARHRWAAFAVDAFLRAFPPASPSLSHSNQHRSFSS